MVGFVSDQNSTESSGLYVDFVDQYVRVYTKQGGQFLGKLIYTDPNKTKFQPYLLDVNTPLNIKAKIVEDRFSQIDTEVIAGIAPVSDGRTYLEEIVRDVAEQNKINTFLRNKDLESKGYK